MSRPKGSKNKQQMSDEYKENRKLFRAEIALETIAFNEKLRAMEPVAPKYRIVDMWLMQDLRDRTTWPPLMTVANMYIRNGSRVAVVASADQYIRWKRLTDAKKLIKSGDLRLFTNLSVRAHVNLYQQCRCVILDGPDARSVERLITAEFFGTTKSVYIRASEHATSIIETVRRLAPNLQKQAFSVRESKHWWEQSASQ